MTTSKRFHAPQTRLARAALREAPSRRDLLKTGAAGVAAHRVRMTAPPDVRCCRLTQERANRLPDSNWN